MGTFYCQGPEGAPPSQMVCSTTPPGPIVHQYHSLQDVTELIGTILIVVAFFILVCVRYYSYQQEDFVSRKERRARIAREDREAAWRHEEAMVAAKTKELYEVNRTILDPIPTLDDPTPTRTRTKR